MGREGAQRRLGEDDRVIEVIFPVWWFPGGVCSLERFKKPAYCCGFPDLREVGLELVADAGKVRVD
jgi:hypothetical protein